MQGRRSAGQVLATIQDNIAAIEWGSLANPRVVGFALARAWVYLMFIGAATSSVTWNGELVPQAAFSISTLTLSAVMFGAALLSDMLDDRLYKNSVRLLGPVLTSAGTLAIAFSTLLEGAPYTTAVVLGGVLTGAGSGLVDLAWGELYRNVPSRQTCLEAPLAFLLAAAVYFLCDGLDVPSIRCAVVALLPMASGWILFSHLKVWSPDAVPAVRPVPVPVSGFALRVGLCAAMVGVADGTVRAVFMQASGTSVYDFYHLPLLLSAAVTLVLIWGCVVCAREFNLRSIYKFSMVIMAFFFQMLPIFVGLPVENVLALAGYGTFNVLIWIMLADAAWRYRLSSLRVFGIGWSMLTVGFFLGSHAGQVLCDSFAPFSPRILSSVALIATIAILLSYMFVLTDADLVELTSMAEERERLLDDERRIAVDAGTASADGGHRKPDAAGDRLADGGTGAAVPGSAEKGADMPFGSRGGRGGTTVGQPAAQAPHKPPRFVSRCKQIAEECGLTERETDVMILYAKGRSYARIQEELYLSRGTITTHLRHIYQKMDVHNKQEFLDYIEGRGTGEAGRPTAAE